MLLSIADRKVRLTSIAFHINIGSYNFDTSVPQKIVLRGPIVQLKINGLRLNQQ